jgi:hypothetical protein
MLTKKRRRTRRQSSRSSARCIANLFFALLIFPVSAWAWGPDGHKIVAVIAADNLTPAAASHVASILGVSADKRAIAAAMEVASNRPDFQFRAEDKATAPWHFIDICLQDRRADVSARCPRNNCVTGKIDEYSKRLKDGTYDRWGASGDLAFLIHFVGDIHQPLHAANDADRGGNCVTVDSNHREKELHAVWDTTVVRGLEYDIDSGKPETTAHKLELTYVSEKDADSWIKADDIAWESNQVARSDIYDALHIPIEPCQPNVNACINPAGRPVELSSAYLDRADAIAGRQLAKAGFRLASLLNEIWTHPVAPNDATHASNPVVPPLLSTTKTNPVGQIVGNRRSKIYAWPGCGTYDKMAPGNRVVFASREDADQQGYRAAQNCP